MPYFSDDVCISYYLIAFESFQKRFNEGATFHINNSAE